MAAARYNELITLAPTESVNVTHIATAHIYFLSPMYNFPPERHRPWEILYLSSGELIVETDSSAFHMHRGQILLIPPYESHGMHTNNVTSHMYVFSFECECEKLIELSDRVLDADPDHARLIDDIVSEGLKYLAGINSIPPLSNGQTPEYASGQLMKNRIELLLIDLIRKAEPQRVPARPANHNREAQQDKALVSEIKDFLTSNVCKKITLADIASGLGYSVPHLCSVFKNDTGQSIMQYFIQQRMFKAKELICDGKMSLTQISDYMGFDSPQYFSYAFKKYTDITPSQYASIVRSKKITIADSAIQIL